MNEENKSTISQASSIEEMADFWDTHSPEDYPDKIYEIDATFDLASRKTAVSIKIDPELFESLRQIAGQRRITTQTLVNIWLQRQVNEVLAG